MDFLSSLFLEYNDTHVRHFEHVPEVSFTLMYIFLYFFSAYFESFLLTSLTVYQSCVLLCLFTVNSIHWVFNLRYCFFLSFRTIIWLKKSNSLVKFSIFSFVYFSYILFNMSIVFIFLPAHNWISHGSISILYQILLIIEIGPVFFSCLVIFNWKYCSRIYKRPVVTPYNFIFYQRKVSSFLCYADRVRRWLS